MASSRPKNHHLSAYLCILLTLVTSGVHAATASSYFSLCRFPVPAPDVPAGHHSHSTQERSPPYISTGHFSGGGNLHFAADRSYLPRSFSFLPRRSAHTTDPAVLHLFATLILEGSGIGGRRMEHHHSVAFELEGYYTTATSTGELCMVGSGSYARDDDGDAKVLLSEVALRLHVPRPSNLSRPFITGSVEGADFGAITLVAYADDDYAHADTALSCPQPASPVRDGRHVLDGASFSCSRLRALLRGSYSLDYRSSGGQAARSSPLRLRHRRMHVTQMSCAADDSVRAYVAFYANQSDSFPSNHSVEWRDDSLFLIGDEALVADGFWDSSRSQLCLRACRVVRSGPSRADLAVGECGIGVSFWFPAVWSIRDQSVATGWIWNTSRTSDGDTCSGVILASRTVSYTYTGDFSDIKYNYTRVEEATKHYHSKPALSTQRKAGRFSGSCSRRDFAFSFSLKKQGLSGSASPVTIGSTLLEGDMLMAEQALSQRAAAEVNNQGLLNVSYYLQYQVHANNWSEMSQKRRIMAEGVYDTKAGYICMVACQSINGSSDCEILVTVQFAPMDAEARHRAVGTISSLREQSDPLFFGAMDFVADGMYSAQRAKLISRMDVEGVMMVVSMALSSVLIALQLRHARKHPEALPAMSITMLVVLTIGNLIPILLNFEPTVMTWRKLFFQFQLSTTGGFALRAGAMLIFVLQLRLLQLVLSGRKSMEAGREDGGASSAAADAERNTLRVCLPLYLVGGTLMLFVNRGDGRDELLLVATGPTPAEVLASYGGLILDAFLLPQVILNAFSGAKATALSPWFYVGGTVNRAAPHVYDLFWAQLYAVPRDGFFGVAWDVAILCGAALLAALLFLQQRLGGAFLCCWRRRSGEYGIVATLSS